MKNSKYWRVLLAQIVTEKTSQSGLVAFKVSLSATKSDIKQAVQLTFNVLVDQVWTCRYKAKPARAGKKSWHARWKKAYVKLATGSEIDVL